GCAFSSSRRHTTFSRDWSSGVCSADLHPTAVLSWQCPCAPPCSTSSLGAASRPGHRDYTPVTKRYERATKRFAADIGTLPAAARMLASAAMTAGLRQETKRGPTMNTIFSPHCSGGTPKQWRPLAERAGGGARARGPAEVHAAG